MDYKNIASAVISALLVGVFLLVVVGIGTDGKDGSNGRDGQDGMGAIPGPDVYNHMFFFAGITQGGFVHASSAPGNFTLDAVDIARINGDTVARIEVTPSGGAGQSNVNITLPASSTLSYFLPNNGDTFSFVFENEAANATTTTIVAGAGMDLQEPDGQNVVIGQNNFAIIKMQRDEDSNFIVWVDESIPG